jgi:DHA3 family macrolide efflux protein-like MFS transporter
MKRQSILCFFAALLLSAFGYEFIYFIMTLHIYDLCKNALNVGVFTALTFIPKLFSALIGGISDKMGKSKCFAFSAIMLSALLFLLSRVTDIRLVYVIWLTASMFFTAIVNIRGSLMADIISSEFYTSGNSVVLSLLNAAKLLGPLLGGSIIMLLNIKLLIYCTCLVYLIVAILSSLIKLKGRTTENESGFLENVKQGFHFMRVNNMFALLTSIAFFWRLFLGLQLSLFVIYIKDYLSGTDKQYGYFITAMGIGSIIGSLLAPYVTKFMKQGRMIILGLTLHYASFIALGVCRSYYGALCIIFFGYMIFYITLVVMHSIRDITTPNHIRSSAYGTTTTILTPPAIVSMLVGGSLADYFGVETVIFYAGLLALISLFWLLNWGRRKGILHTKERFPM